MYGGFLFVDYFFLSKMTQTLTTDEHTRAREAIMVHVRKVVPYALFTAVGSGIYLISQVFGEITPEGLSSFQTLLLIKALFGLWLGVRGFNQKVFGINPWVFKTHTLPFVLVVSIIILSQYMHL
ncbi:MAG TPA: hypothetical protein VJA83_09790 [Sulfuricurvum sp.]|nr:hypothetical protein [Sulfuricurvum sp.]